MSLRKNGKRLLFPHPLAVASLSVAAFSLLAYAFVRLEPSDPVRIASYALSFCALALLCVRVPEIIRFAMRFRQENRYAVRYASDVRLRINISLIGACVFNAVYAAFQLALGLWHRSAWYYSMGAYYLLLALMRLLLVRHTRRHAPCEQLSAEWKEYRFCGVCILTMTLILSVFITYFIFRIREFRHHEITVIAMAAYSFASLTLAIFKVIRYKNYGSPAYSAAKAISLVSAVVSMLSLENAMLTAFGNDGNELFRRIMLSATGVAAVFIVQAIAVHMILRAGRALRGSSYPINQPSSTKTGVDPHEQQPE